MKRQTWLATNRATIMARLRWLHDEPDGILFSKQSALNVVVVDKVESNIRLWLLDPMPKLIQSRFDLTNPLHLVSPYSQAALLGLVWKREPKRVYVTGFGGGRLPLALHHYLPEVIVEATETEPLVIEAAAKFFGVQPDARFIVVNQDGRDYLAQREASITYDLIFNDAFSGNAGPFHLATQGFYKLCRNRLTEGGAVIVNLLLDDPLYVDKVKTIQSVFTHIYLWLPDWGNGLVIGSNAPPLAQPDLIERARVLQIYHQFSFSLLDRACELKVGPALNEYLSHLDRATILTDAPTAE